MNATDARDVFLWKLTTVLRLTVHLAETRVTTFGISVDTRKRSSLLTLGEGEVCKVQHVLNISKNCIGILFNCRTYYITFNYNAFMFIVN